MWNIIYLVTGAVFEILLLIIFFSKEVIDSKENKFFKSLIIINCIEYAAEIPLQIIVRRLGIDSPLVDVFARLYLEVIFTWFSFFSIYTFIICLDKRDVKKYEKQFSVIKNINIVIWMGGLFLLYLIPFNKFYDSSKMYIYGGAADALKILLGAYIIVWIILLMKNIKNIKEKKYVPIFLVILLLGLNTILQTIDPSVLIATMVGTLVCYTMYFTIENPDVKIMAELSKNRKIIEKSNEDHSNLIFKITQDVRKPIREIIEITSDTNDEKLQEINNLGKNLDYLIEDALDVSQMTTKKLKLYNTRYNPRNLFNEIKYRAESKLDDNVKLEYSISTNVPDYVYGDSIKLKQILSSILENSIEHTKKGYITLEINTIIKYGICRFIIDVNDNGRGISIDKVNEILSFKDTEETFNPDKERLTLRETKLLTNKIGGSFMIKSNEESGSTVSITIDQKIVESKDKEISKKLELYEESLQRNKKIMVVDDDTKELAAITNYLEENQMIVSGSLYARDAIEKIESSHKFDLIILDDETNTYSAYETLKELKKTGKFNTPVVIMIDDNKEFIKLHYLKDGFADVIMKSKLKKELDRVLKRF